MGGKRLGRVLQTSRASRYDGGAMGEPNGYYDSIDEYEIGKGEVIGPDGHVSVVIRTYEVPHITVALNRRLIQFVPLEDLQSEYDVAVYIPSSLSTVLPFDVMTEIMSSLIRIAGIGFHQGGAEAVNRL